jgi:4-diphosphocytidyl-2-C-methyl-D-erythritol kinase
MIDVLAPAKINLHLRILAREDSGYHSIETIFARIALADRLHLRESGPGIQLFVEGQDLGPVADNLVHRAATAFYQASRLTPALAIRLEKHIPAGAGLGGGSSDAAATLAALNLRHGRPLDPVALHRLALAIGSDVPFFLTGAGLVLAWGRGERCLRLPDPPDRNILLAVPSLSIGTAGAYELLAAHRAQRPQPPPAPLPDPDRLADWDVLAGIAANDFEDVLFALYPPLARLRDALADAGARPARLTGSGAAVFGIFAAGLDIAGAAARVRAAVPGTRVVATRTAFSGHELHG